MNIDCSVQCRKVKKSVYYKAGKKCFKCKQVFSWAYTHKHRFYCEKDYVSMDGVLNITCPNPNCPVFGSYQYA